MFTSSASTETEQGPLSKRECLLNRGFFFFRIRVLFNKDQTQGRAYWNVGAKSNQYAKMKSISIDCC